MSFGKKLCGVFAVGAVFLLAAVSYAYTPDSNAPRSAVPDNFKWDTSAVFKSDAAFEAGFKDVSRRLDEIQKFKGKITNAGEFAACLKEFFAVRRAFDPVWLYSNLKKDQDEEVKSYEKMNQSVLNFTKDSSAKTSFIKQAILKMKEDEMEKFLKNPEMSPYRGYISDIARRRVHYLGEEAENVLSLAADNLFSEIDLNEVPSDIEQAFKATMRDLQLPKIKDENGKEVQLTLSNYPKYRSSKDRRVRAEAVEAFFGALKKYNNILAATLAGQMKLDVFMAKARKYDHAMDAYLDRENVDPAVVDNLIKTVNANVGVLHRYVALRKKLLGLPDVHIYDLYTPIVPAVSMEVPYEKAAEDIAVALKPLGDEYISVASKAMKSGSGWIDAYPNKGKKSGAYSVGYWGYHPYILLNYMDEVDDASTLAHELGHTMHSYLNNEANSYQDFGSSTTLAEIASTFNEKLFSDHLLGKYRDNDDMRLYLLGERVETIRTTIIRQTLFAEFEKRIHDYAEAGTPLTADLMNKTYGDLIKKYFGPGFTVGKNDDIEWAYIPHFYYKFYVYAYATGLSSAIDLAGKVGGGDTKARDRYLAMLKEPRFTPPLTALKKAGVDLTKPDAIQAAMDLMNRSITEMEKIAAKKK